MLELSRICLAAATVLLTLALVSNVVIVLTRNTAARKAAAKEAALVGASGAGGAEPERLAASPAVVESPSRGLGWYTDRTIEISLVLLTVGLAARTFATGHAPFANQYEFACSFAWGMTLAYVFFNHRYRLRTLSLAILPLPVLMLLYAATVGSEAVPLMPALDNHLLLTLHVATAILGYGAAAVAFGAAVFYLIRPHLKLRGLPSEELLDEIGYRAVVITFPMLTIMIILGAVWADIAWGRYWSWDPKETASLVTWLIYGAYLHARVSRGWRGNRSAGLLILGFVAILFTYYGNLFFGGLHAYA
ncbi:c-type cytochrome biogenesis protein CcsB [Propioniciclava soli]|uniref:C-type cytochrome biogenesis protein CcsB n=1 Tax=Propioniciclava soli TaxID=2775081 RepID=A0ABZ3C7W5_9ACTN